MPELRRIALELLARREHSAAELRRKLWRRAGDEAATQALVDDLVRDGWVDDRRFAESFVRSRTDKGFGPLRIDGELRARGVDLEVIQGVVWGSDQPWRERAETARRKRFSGDPPADRSGRAKQSRFLESRGFTREQIGRILWRNRRDEEFDD